jgi:hypothetical protein
VCRKSWVTASCFLRTCMMSKLHQTCAICHDHMQQVSQYSFYGLATRKQHSYFHSIPYIGHVSSLSRATSPHYRPIIIPLSGISYPYRFLLFKNIAFGPPLLVGTFYPKNRKRDSGGKTYLRLSRCPPVVAELPKASSKSRVRT